MKRGVLAATMLAWLGVAAPAAAYLVEVTTSVAVSDASDQAKITTAVQSAVDEVLRDAIAFRPTMVVLTRALVIGERLYIRLLIADQDGEQTAKDLAVPPSDDDEEAAARPRVDI
jgi:hypothetical protein